MKDDLPFPLQETTKEDICKSYRSIAFPSGPSTLILSSLSTTVSQKPMFFETYLVAETCRAVWWHGHICVTRTMPMYRRKGAWPKYVCTVPMLTSKLRRHFMSLVLIYPFEPSRTMCLLLFLINAGMFSRLILIISLPV